jgi:hypothetical protein
LKRNPWPAGFPDVVVHTTVRVRDAHPDYFTAKTGDSEAAARLVRDLVTADGLAKVAAVVAGRSPIVVPVSAIESGGYNAIPDAYARFLGRRLQLRVEEEIDQANSVGHTRSSGFVRLARRATFEGPVLAGDSYLIADDHVGLGGTIAELRAYIEANGAAMIGATTLTRSRDSHHIALRPETLRQLREKHGQSLEDLWRERFGYGLDGLTEPEAGYLLRTPDVERIRAGLAEAEAVGNLRGG